MKEGKT